MREDYFIGLGEKTTCGGEVMDGDKKSTCMASCMPGKVTE